MAETESQKQRDNKTALLVRALVKSVTTPEQLQANSADHKRRADELLAEAAANPDMSSADLIENHEATLEALYERIAILDALRLYPLANAVIDHADRKGWALIREPGDWLTLCGAIGRSRTAHGAIARVAKVMKPVTHALRARAAGPFPITG